MNNCIIININNIIALTNGKIRNVPDWLDVIII